MAGGGYDGERGFMETRSYSLGIIFLGFILISLIFEFATHELKHTLAKRKHPGLVKAVDNMISELMLLGLFSLLLSVVQDPLTSINTYHRSQSDWYILSRAATSCHCCLQNTLGVSTQVMDYCKAEWHEDSECPYQGDYHGDHYGDSHGDDHSDDHVDSHSDDHVDSDDHGDDHSDDSSHGTPSDAAPSVDVAQQTQGAEDSHTPSEVAKVADGLSEAASKGTHSEQDTQGDDAEPDDGDTPAAAGGNRRRALRRVLLGALDAGEAVEINPRIVRQLYPTSHGDLRSPASARRRRARRLAAEADHGEDSHDEDAHVPNYYGDDPNDPKEWAPLVTGSTLH